MLVTMGALIGGVVLAEVGGWGPGDGRDGGWWPIWPLVTALWILLVALAVRWIVFGRFQRAPSEVDRARGILAERFARGEIDAQEYEERSKRLR